MILVALLLACLALWAPHVWGTPAAQYTFVPLGEGVIVALDPDEEHALGARLTHSEWQGIILSRTHPPQVLPSLPDWITSRARAVRRNRVVGHQVPTSGAPLIHAVLLEGATIIDLGLDPLLGDYSTAACVTDAGEVGGSGNRDHARAFPLPLRWLVGGAVQVLATLGGPTGFIETCSATGDFAGYTAVAGGSIHATRWSAPTFVAEDLQTLPWTVVRESRVFALSETQEAVGSALLPTGESHAMTWTPSTGMAILTPLPGDTHSRAMAVNDAGDKVGSSWNLDILAFGAPRHQAILWGADRVPVALQARVNAPLPWDLQAAVGIGPHGVIAVTGVRTMTLDGRPYQQPVAGLLIPQP